MIRLAAMSSSTDRSNDSEVLSGSIDTGGLYLAWAEAPWDSAIFGYPVIQINGVEVRGQGAHADLAAFERARDACGSRLVSCRLPHERLRESMFLEDEGFRFVEMLYRPELGNLQSRALTNRHDLTASLAVSEDLPALLDIAGTAFRNERIHVDPRLSPQLGDQRYQRWVQSSLDHASQRLWVLRDGKAIVAFFVTETLSDDTCYWHLNAVAPDLQGRGYGRRAWEAMLSQAQMEGAKRVRTSVVAGNYRVLNLYAQLGFRLASPLMTFHWVRTE